MARTCSEFIRDVSLKFSASSSKPLALNSHLLQAIFSSICLRSLSDSYLLRGSLRSGIIYAAEGGLLVFIVSNVYNDYIP
jgi:hypothetical protein